METRASAPRPGIQRRWIVLITLAIVLLLAATSALYLRARLDPGTPVVGVSQIAVQDDQFAPAAIEVPAGTTVSWEWDGIEEHNVVGDGFESSAQVEGDFSHTFNEPGTHAYECTLHFFMRGEVVVTD
ncbi:MAG: cupredoxin domain-containing protein [Chloroflexota bacterium]|nr:cupredoxin domain-containing protein [Chloroflexota bacterium]